MVLLLALWAISASSEKNRLRHEDGEEGSLPSLDQRDQKTGICPEGNGVSEGGEEGRPNLLDLVLEHRASSLHHLSLTY